MVNIFSKHFQACLTNKPLMVFDWIKAAKLIIEKCPTIVKAGLQDDWDMTSGIIYCDNQIVPYYIASTYLASNWAIPQIDIDNDILPCFITDNIYCWTPYTYWPEIALRILEKG